LQQHIGDATVDLVYLDPPFNSNRDYNVLFKEQSGKESPAQIKAFGDTWNRNLRRQEGISGIINGSKFTRDKVVATWLSH